MRHLARKIYLRPPIFIFLTVLSLSTLCLIGQLIRFQTIESIVDPDAKSNSAKLLLTLAELEFCSEPWSSSTKQFQLNEAFLLNLDHKTDPQKSQQVFAKHLSLKLAYDYAPTQGIRPLFARMRGSHLGLTGSDALEKINISLIVPKFSDDQKPCVGSDCEQHIFDSCLVLAAPIKLFPHLRDYKPCTRVQMQQINSSDSAQLLWQNHHRIVEHQRCKGHKIWRPKMKEQSPIQAVISPDDVQLISQRLVFIICLLLTIIFSICVSLMCMNPPELQYSPLPFEQRPRQEQQHQDPPSDSEVFNN